MMGPRGQAFPSVKRETNITIVNMPQPVKTDLNKMLDSKQKNFQTINIDAQGLRKTKNENPLTWEIGATS